MSLAFGLDCHEIQHSGKAQASADGSADHVHGDHPDHLICYPLESLNIGGFGGGELLREFGKSFGCLFEKNAHTGFPFNSRRVPSAPEAHDKDSV